jgi:hypothetical protein
MSGAAHGASIEPSGRERIVMGGRRFESARLPADAVSTG